VRGGDNTLCQGITRTSQGSINGFTNTLLNIGGIEVQGIDFVAGYRMPRKDFGRLRFQSQTSYLRKYWEKTPSAEGFVTTEREGTLAGTPERAFPRFKSQLAIGWLYQRFDVTLTTRYISGVVEGCRDLEDFPGTCSKPNLNDATQSKNRLDPTVYNDVQVVWSPEAEPKLTVTAGVNNLFDRDPPTCYACALNGFNGQTYDVPGIFGYFSAAYRLP
jgi:iron complex outermembrane receptor protein